MSEAIEMIRFVSLLFFASATCFSEPAPKLNKGDWVEVTYLNGDFFCGPVGKEDSGGFSIDRGKDDFAKSDIWYFKWKDVQKIKINSGPELNIQKKTP